MLDKTELLGPSYIWKILEEDLDGCKVLLIAAAYKGAHRVTFKEAQTIIQVNFFSTCDVLFCKSSFNLFDRLFISLNCNSGLHSIGKCVAFSHFLFLGKWSWGTRSQEI